MAGKNSSRMDQLGQFKPLYHVADKVIGGLSRDRLAEAAVGKLTP